MKPLAIDLFCGLGGWTEGLLAEGYNVVGFDNERHAYGGEKYPAQLVIQDVLTLHGSQFKDAALIVASPPCQEYSWMAMPWSKAKERARQYDSGERDRADLTRLFDACFRIQREASEAAGRNVPMVVENVRGAQRWVGRARWNYGSFYLWGDVPALMPYAKYGLQMKYGKVCLSPEEWKRVQAGEDVPHPHNGTKNPGFRFDGSGRSMQSESVERHVRQINKAWRDKHYDDAPKMQDGRKQPGIGDGVKAGAAYRGKCSGLGVAQHTGSKSNARKAASARIAKIPLALARHVAASWYPR